MAPSTSAPEEEERIVGTSASDARVAINTTPVGTFGVSLDELNALNADKDMDALQRLGGLEGLAHAIHASPKEGLNPECNPEEDRSIERHRAVFGENRFKEAPPKSILALVWDALQDPIILLLIFAALVSTILGAAIPEERAKNGWIEGVAIWVAIVVVVSVGAGNDWQKDRQFRELNAQKEAINVKVVRGHQQILVPNTDIVVGDVMLLDTGDKVVADALLLDSQGLIIDEASLTGESDPIKKSVDHDPWVRSGTQVSEGSGRVLVVAVGVNSEWGKTMALMEDAGDEQTPLQEKLEDVAGAIGKVGFGVAIACFIALLIKWCVENNGFPISQINNNGPIQFFLYSITIIVVAVPEGLPLAVTISLAYSMKKMMKDNNFVRVLAACETMGGATAICSDKTGTLTENRMTVVEGWFAGRALSAVPPASDLAPGLLANLAANIAMSSKAFLVEPKPDPSDPNAAARRIEFVGNRTECALLMLLRAWGLDYQREREERADQLFKLYGFSSAKKMSSVLLRGGDAYQLYNKGAAEWVIARCVQQSSPSGSPQALDEAGRKALLEVVTGMASRGLRCIALTHKQLPLEAHGRSADFFESADNVDTDLCLDAIVGIKDPVRREVPDAVATCQRAGIVVRMVTGDNIHTARHIARECGILPSEGSEFMAMEGPTFRNTPEGVMQELLPRLRVLARSSPEDKLTLVRMLKGLGEVVAVTGDGTNDAPALKESDVGLAMGIAGTEVAKEAADIVIMDDNFSSIVKSVLWGRSVFNNIRKFLQFQLTVNFVALVTAFVGAIVGGHEPLTVLQLLWVNLIMDSMGALALATEPPSPALLNDRPHGRTDALITKTMWKHILLMGLYQLFWMFVCLYALPVVIPRYKITSRQDYYLENCYSHTIDKFNATATTLYCNWMNVCGFDFENPDGSRNTPACTLYNDFWQFQNSTGGTVPDDQAVAVCLGANECPANDEFNDAKGNLSDDFEDDNEKEWQEPLSVLFNAFILMQVANEINSRRIRDEFTMFQGLLHSPIFMGVILITIGLQAIIINFLGTFFKVQPLDWKEWLACLAIGVGAFPMSLAIRFVSRLIDGTFTCDLRPEEPYHTTQSMVDARMMAGEPMDKTAPSSVVIRRPDGGSAAPLPSHIVVGRPGDAGSSSN